MQQNQPVWWKGRKVRHWSESSKYFSINGNSISLVKEYSHLGHIITSDLDDITELIRKRIICCVAKLTMSYAISRTGIFL